MSKERDEGRDDRSERRLDEPGLPQSTVSTARHVHSREDVKSKSLIVSIIAILVTLGIIHLIIVGMVLIFLASHRKDNPPPPALTTLNPLPPEPRLQQNPAADLTRLLAEQHKILASYGWVDQKAGVARIPIERAIDIVAQRGLPPKKTDANTTLGTQILLHR